MSKTKYILGCFLFLMAYQGIGVYALNKVKLSEEQFFKAFHQYQTVSVIEAPFHQDKVLVNLAMTLQSQGKLTVIRPHTVIWEVGAPSYMKAVFKEKRVLIQYGQGKLKETEEWSFDQVSSKASKGLALMLAWLQFDVVTLYHQYDIFLMEPDVYEFVPKDRGSHYTSITVRLHKEGLVEQIKMMEKSGDVIHLKFKNVRVTKIK